MKTVILAILLAIFGAICYEKFYLPMQKKPARVAVAPSAEKQEAEEPRASKIKVKMYRWIDADGVLQFAENPPKDPNIKVEVMEVVTKAEPENPTLLYDEKLKGRTFGQRTTGTANLIGSRHKSTSISNSACDAARRAVSSARRQGYSDRKAFRSRMDYLEARVRKAC